MNLIESTVLSLQPSLASSRSLTEHARARSAHAALAPYERPADVLAALGESSGLSLEEHDAIVLALLREHQSTRHPLWQAVLLTAFAPMVHRVAKRTLGVLLDDARQGALAGFLDAIGKVRVDPAPSRLSLSLRHATERVAFGQAVLPSEPEATPLSAADDELDPRDAIEALHDHDQMKKVLVALTEAFGDEPTAREVLDVLIHARTGRRPLADYVDEMYAGLTRKRRDAILARLWKLRARGLAHLHKVFGRDLDLAVAVSVVA